MASTLSVEGVEASSAISAAVSLPFLSPREVVCDSSARFIASIDSNCSSPQDSRACGDGPVAKKQEFLQ